MPARTSSRQQSGHGSSLIQAPRRKSKVKKRLTASSLHRLSDTPSVGSCPDKVSESEVVDVTEVQANQRQDALNTLTPKGTQAVEEEIQEEPKQKKPSMTAEQLAAERLKCQQEIFDEMDIDGNGNIDKQELQAGLVDMGVVGAEVADVNRFFLMGKNNLTFDDFVGGNVLDELKVLRKEKAAEDITSYGVMKTEAHRKTFIPDRMLRIVLEYCPISTMRAMGSTCQTFRTWATADVYWKSLLLKKRRLQQANKKVGLFSMPEVRCHSEYFQWYVDWVRELVSENGAKLWVERIKTELMAEGEAQIHDVAKPITCGCVLEPVVYQAPPSNPPSAAATPEPDNQSKAPSDSQVSEPAATPTPTPEPAGKEDDEPPPPPPPELPTMALGNEGGVVSIYSITTPDKVVCQLDEHDGAATCLACTNTYVFVGSDDCTVSVWDRADLVRPTYFLVGHKEAVSAMAVPKWDDKQVVSGSMDRTVVIWSKLEIAKRKKRKSDAVEIQQIRPKHVLEGHTMKVSDLLVTQTHIFSASRDSVILAWSWAGQQMLKMEGHMGPVNVIKFLPPISEDTPVERRVSDVGDSTLLSVCGGGLLKAWNMKGRQVMTKKIHEAPIETMEVCTELRLVITASWDNTVCITNPGTETILAQLKGHQGIVRQVIVDPRRRRVITGSDDKCIGIWSFHQLEPRSRTKVILDPHYMLTGPKAPITAVALTTDHKGHWYTLFAGVKDKAMYTWCFLPESQLQKKFYPLPNH